MTTIHLLLDFDGTLADSSPGIFQSFRLACDSLGLQTPDLEVFRSLIGPQIQVIAASLFPELRTNDLETFRRVFREDYDQRSYRLTHWYPGVMDTLRILGKNKHIRLCIVTNKPTTPTHELIRQAGLSGCLDRVIGIDYLSIYSGGSVFGTKAEALSYAIASSSFDATTRLYVGDTPSDQRASSESGLEFVAALYGFHQWSFNQLPPKRIQEFAQIKDLLNLPQP